MWIDITPLRQNRDFRFLYFGQFISFLGTMLSFVALPYQVYELTHSTFSVGMLGVVELVPLLLTAFIGGALADTVDRKKLLVRAEVGLACGCLLLVINASLSHPHIWLIFFVAGLMSALNGLHRPSLDAMVPRLVKHEEIQAVSILAALKANIGMIGGPALAGLFLAHFGLKWTYALDLLTFVLSIGALMQLKSGSFIASNDTPNFKSVLQAIKYAVRRQELLGTYLIDFCAMVFAMPNALFPAIAHSFGQTKAVGWLYSAPAVGALVVTLLSGWTKKIMYHGRAVAIAATCWGLAIIAFGLSSHFWTVLLCLAFAGSADCVSGIFRSTMWNETIPDNLRGRMAGLEMISYMSGPLLGNAQVGLMASLTSVNTAVVIGGSLCVTAVMIGVLLLPGFWNYKKGSVSVINE